jgi:ribosomal protein S18 acetylase RimI-like enzyme
LTTPFVIEPLASNHDRTAFRCGVDALDRYLHHQATQDIRRRVSSCFVAVETETRKLAGFYTMAAGGIPLADMPDQLVKKLPRYPSVPIARLGRLAIDQDFQGKQLGAALLWDAMARSSRSEVAVFAMVVDAKDEQAVGFYRHHGFVTFGSLPNQLLYPLTGLIPKN